MWLRRGLLISLLCGSLALASSSAQPAWADDAQGSDRAGKPTVKFSWDGRFFFDDLPHGKAFLVKIAIPEGLTFKEGTVWRADGKCEKTADKTRILPFESADADGERTVTLSVPALKYSVAYCFRFKATEGLDREQIEALGTAVEAMIQAISERRLYTAARRAAFLKGKLGDLASATVVIDDKAAQVLDWVTEWTEGEDRFVALWQQHGERQRAAGKVGDHADRLRRLDLGDDQLAVPGPPAALTSAIQGLDGVRKAIDKSGFARTVTAHLTSATPPTLTAVAVTLRENARSLREQAQRAHRQVCARRAKASMSLSELGIEIGRLQREIGDLERQLASTAPGDRKDRAALEQLRARLEAAKRALVERRTDRLCKNLINLRTYSGRLADALTDEAQAGVEIARLSGEIRQVITDRKARIPVEVVHGTRSADPTYTERATAYISADVGAVFPRFSTSNWGASLFIGVNFTFRPVDKDIPLSEDGGFGKRFSLIAGLTVTEFRDEANSVTGVAGGQAALLGVGYRVSDYLRLGAGGVLFRQTHPNPAIDSKSLKVAPYVAISVDSDIGGLIKNVIVRGKKSAL